MATNKRSASEDDVGLLHNAITKGFTAKVGHMLEQFEEAEEAGDNVGKMMAIDTRDLAAAAKWVQANEVTCAMPEVQGDNALKKQLDAIKAKQQGRVISMTDSIKEA